MSELRAYVDGVAVLGCGITGWPAAAAALAGRSAYAMSRTVLPAPTALPAAERRRTGSIVKLAIALGLEATGGARVDAATLVTVFASSNGDGDICHEICATLATPERQISPTRFHNSVHNAAAGYWSIATGATAASTTVSAYDASFAAGLLEAIVQATVHQHPVLLIACDTPYPSPLHEKRVLADPFGVALVLAPDPGQASIARLSASLGTAAVDRCAEPALEALRLGTPAGRSLSLLALLARSQSGSVAVEYLGATSLCLEVEPC